MAKLARGQRVTGDDREKLTKVLRKKYEGGASIRELASVNGRSYGFIHRMLKDDGVAMRGRGGATRGKSKS
ncbi:MAG: helix-turn-helix domain-containing protein [Candidatus Nanopelagicales bacterium]|nr:helix-turn-helix domain-containing protein [Candidatus Nanopelagicales bacterium]